MSKEKSLLPMLFGVGALGIAMVLGAVYLLSGYIMKGLGQTAASMNTSPRRELPVIEVSYRGPMYPNGRRVEDSQAKVALDLPVNANYSVASTEYVTEDGLDQAIAYYRKYFGKTAVEHLSPGGARWLEKRPDGFGLVLLREAPDKLHITLVLVVEEPQ